MASSVSASARPCLAAAVEAGHGRLDGLVTCAGLRHVGSAAETRYDDWKRVMAVNADGVFLATHWCWPLLERSAGASIVNLSSVSGLVGGARLAAYNASKGAVRLFSKSVALSGAKCTPPIRCNSVHPAFVEGSMVETLARAHGDPAITHEKMRAMVPLRRYAQPGEVAATVAWLLSPASSFATGAEWVLDGGLTAS